MAAGVNAAADAAPAPRWNATLYGSTSALDRRRLPGDAEAALVRALHQLGAGAPARRPGARAGRPELAARLDPTYPEANAVVLTPGIPAGAGTELAERVDSIRRFLGMTVEATGKQLGRRPSRSASGGALIAGDPHLAHDAGHHLPARASAGRPLLPRRLAPGTPGSPSATTTTWRGRSRTRWATSWTCSSSGSTASATCSRTSGATCCSSTSRSRFAAATSRAAGTRCTTGRS